MLESLFNRVAAQTPDACFPVNFAKFLRKPFFVEHLQWLLLNDYAHANNSPSFMFQRFLFSLPPSKLAYVINKWPFINYVGKLRGRKAEEETLEHEGRRVVCMCVIVEKQPLEVFYKKGFS